MSYGYAAEGAFEQMLGTPDRPLCVPQTGRPASVACCAAHAGYPTARICQTLLRTVTWLQGLQDDRRWPLTLELSWLACFLAVYLNSGANFPAVPGLRFEAFCVV